MKLESPDSEVFGLYPRAIGHMYRQLSNKRFGLILGSGVSKPLGYPDWKGLIDRIAQDPSVSGGDLIETIRDKPLPLQAQILFGRFCDRKGASFKIEGLQESDAQRILRAEWRNLVHHCLYRDVQEDRNALQDTVYGYFAPVVRESPLTVNYNFDDTLERLLLNTRPQPEEERTRGYETVVDARLQFRRDTAIIYHPNGFLPKNLLDNPSDYVVLTEDSLGDQLIESMSGQYASLVNHLSKNTCLLVGLSLEDQTRGTSERKVHPGHVILLIGEMAVRVKSQNKDSNQDYTSSLQRAMQQLYVGPGVTHVDVRGNNIHEVVKKVSRIVHLDEYEECDLQGLLDRVEVGEIGPPPGTVDG